MLPNLHCYLALAKPAGKSVNNNSQLADSWNHQTKSPILDTYAQYAVQYRMDILIGKLHTGQTVM